MHCGLLWMHWRARKQKRKQQKQKWMNVEVPGCGICWWVVCLCVCVYFIVYGNPDNAEGCAWGFDIRGERTILFSGSVILIFLVLVSLCSVSDVSVPRVAVCIIAFGVFFLCSRTWWWRMHGSNVRLCVHTPLPVTQVMLGGEAFWG